MSRWQNLRRFIAAGLVVAALGVVLGHRQILREIDAAWSDTDRWGRLLRYRFGLPLPGTPALDKLSKRLAAVGLHEGAPILLRVFKAESILELWLKRGERFDLFARYPICRWSGHLGPKLKEGDHQSPEGFYTVDARALNPNSRWHRSFNLGFPNAFDQAHGRTGSFIMVHGGCSSIGCFAMTNAVVDEIWRLVKAALANGQRRFQVQVFPFRITDARLDRHTTNRWYPFWQQLKLGHDLFEFTRLPPEVTVCAKQYEFSKGASHGTAPIRKACALKKRAAITTPLR